jgi:hypothetical protein
MQATLTIKDLPAHRELGRSALRAVRGGQDNQANGTSQMNVQHMAAVANIGNGSLILGPATLQSDNTFSQHATNTSFSANADFARFGLPLPGLR